MKECRKLSTYKLFHLDKEHVRWGRLYMKGNCDDCELIITAVTEKISLHTQTAALLLLRVSPILTGFYLLSALSRSNHRVFFSEIPSPFWKNSIPEQQRFAAVIAIVKHEQRSIISNVSLQKTIWIYIHALKLSLCVYIYIRKAFSRRLQRRLLHSRSSFGKHHLRVGVASLTKVSRAHCEVIHTLISHWLVNIPDFLGRRRRRWRRTLCPLLSATGGGRRGVAAVSGEVRGPRGRRLLDLIKRLPITLHTLAKQACKGNQHH